MATIPTTSGRGSGRDGFGSSTVAVGMRRAAAAAAFLGGVALGGGAAAAPATFDITGGGYSVGSGYGCGNDQSLLCATFGYLLDDPASFVLGDVGDSTTLQFGSIQLNEADGPGSATHIDGGETDNLSVTAFLDFLSPFGGSVQSVATVVATAGSLSDAATDFSLTFAPAQQAFGSGGLFSIDFGTLTFTQNGVTLPHSVQITLLSAPTTRNEATASAVPEPQTLGLLAFGLLGLAMFRRHGVPSAAARRSA